MVTNLGEKLEANDCKYVRPSAGEVCVPSPFLRKCLVSDNIFCLMKEWTIGRKEGEEGRGRNGVPPSNWLYLSNAATKRAGYGVFVFYLSCPLGTHSKQEHLACVTSRHDNRPSWHYSSSFCPKLDSESEGYVCGWAGEKRVATREHTGKTER